jgi:hypothetical protein
MNEIELIRGQLLTERQHASAVANACATALGRIDDVVAPSSGSPLEEFRQACVEYLVCVLTWFEERDQRLVQLWHARLSPADGERRALDDLLASRGRSREALEKLAAALASAAEPRSEPSADHGAQENWHEFGQFFNGVWRARRDAIDALLAPTTRTSDWREFGGIDADSILEERARYARVHATLPAGTSLNGAPQRGL